MLQGILKSTYLLFFPMMLFEISVRNKACGFSSVSSHILWRCCPRGDWEGLAIGGGYDLVLL